METKEALGGYSLVGARWVAWVLGEFLGAPLPPLPFLAPLLPTIDILGMESSLGT
jgi:hypothetical protein